MATMINVNGTLVLDQTTGVQDNDFAIANDLTGLNTTFRTFLLGLAGDLTLSAAQRAYADTVEAAKTSATYITVTQNSASITDLFFSDPNGDAFDGDQVFYNGSPLKTISGDNIYFHSYAGGNIVLATTSQTEGVGDVVAAFYLNEAGDHLSAGIEMVTFMAIAHPNATNPDDRIDWTNLLNVSAAGSLTFNFDVLDAGKFLWAAIGDSAHGLLISGYSLAVDSNSKAISNSSDFVNTSKGGLGATIGIDNQMFTPGDVAVLTLVEGFDPLSGGTGQAHSDYLIDKTQGGNTYEGINYTGYTDVGGAKLFFSQDQGAGTFSAKISLWEAGGAAGTPEQELAYKGSGTSGAFNDDSPVTVKTVTIYGASLAPGVLGPVIGTWSTAPTVGQVAFGTLVGGVRVSLDGTNGFIMTGLDAFYTAAWTVADGETFNRFRLSAEEGKFDVGRMDIDQGLTITRTVGDSLFVDDDGPTPGMAVTKHVDEDAMTGAGGGDLSTGHIETPDDGDDIAGEQDEVSFSQSDLAASVNSGTDSPATFSLNASLANGTAVTTISGANVYSQGDQVFYRTVSGVIQGVTDAGTADERIIFTITRNENGTPADLSDDSFTFDLKDQLDHANASGELGLLALNLTPAFSAKDADNDPVNFGSSALIRVEVENDTPRPDGDFVRKHVDEDAMTGMAGSDLSTGHVETPDDGDGIAGEQDEVSFSQADLQGVVTNGADEPVLFSLNLALTNGSAVKTVGGADVYSKGQQVTWNVNGSTIEGVAGGRIIFTITRNNNGTPSDPSDDTFQFDLKDQLDHANASGELGLLDLNVTPAFNASDYDGDAVSFTGSSAIRVEVENDTPRADGDTVSKEVHEDALTGGNTPDTGDAEAKVLTATYSNADLVGLATNGADEDLTFSLNTAASGSPGAVIGTNVVTTAGATVTSKGANVTWAAGDTPGSLKGISTVGGVVTTIFTLAPSMTPGNFVFTLVDQVDHSGAENDQELVPIDLTSAFRAVDFDNDPLTLNADSIVMNVENDLPVFTGQIASKTLDWIDENSVQSSLNGRAGGDEPASYVIDKYTDLDGYTELLSPDGKTLTYSRDGKVYFTLALSDTANSGAGGYTFTVNEPPPMQVRNLSFEDLDSGQNLFGTIAFNKLNIDTNGTPGTGDDFLPDGGLMTFPSNLDINDLDLTDPVPSKPAESDDGTMTSDSGTTNTSKGGGPVTIGNTNQAFDSMDEGAWFCYVDDPRTTAVSGVGLDPNLADDADNVKFNGMIGVRSASVEIVQASGAGTAKRPGPDMLVEAWNLNPGNVDTDAESRQFVLDPTLGGTRVSIIGIKIYDANGVMIEHRTNMNMGATNGGTLMDSDDPGTTVSGADDSAVNISFVLVAGGGTMTTDDDIYVAFVGNLRPNYTIEWLTATDHNASLVLNRSGSYDIGGFNLLQGQDTPDVDLEFSVAIEDSDNDQYRGFDTTFEDFKIKVDGTGVNNDPANTAPTGFAMSYDSAPMPLSMGLMGDGNLAMPLDDYAYRQEDMLL